MQKVVGVFVIAVAFMTTTIAVGYAEDACPEPITAEQAFDAYIDQVDPVSGEDAKVLIVDVRTKAEYYWIGTCAKVDEIITQDDEGIIPYRGKVKLRRKKFLTFEEEENSFLVPVVMPACNVESMKTSPIATLISYEIWDEESCKKVLNDNFEDSIAALAVDDDVDVIILMCRSGKRTTLCPITPYTAALFTGVYEIEHENKNGRGGFQGTSYNNSYNGYRGFPGRKTSCSEYPSVSWCDAGLSIHIGACSSNE